jgi:hypothetical protein
MVEVIAQGEGPLFVNPDAEKAREFFRQINLFTCPECQGRTEIQCLALSLCIFLPEIVRLEVFLK